jgi:di/tricarboxylate transporter
VLAGLVAPAEAFAGFGHPAVITVACVLVLSRGLQTRARSTRCQRRCCRSAAGPSALSPGALGALLSGFMNNVGALALLMPVAMQVASRLAGRRARC